MFLVLFLKRTTKLVFFFWGQPRTPWLRFAEIYAACRVLAIAFIFADRDWLPNIREADPGGLGALPPKN
jgi:hypothetical protein